MNTVFTIYINERPLYIARSAMEALANYHQGNVFNVPSQQEIEAVIARLEKGDLPGAVLTGPNPQSLLDQVKKLYTEFLAAGGLVLKEPGGEILLMFRRGKWDLPKGKLDDGEDLPTCALREVQEETGLQNVRIDSPLMETYHYYPLEGKKILKHTYWYKMKFTGNELTIPQIEEDILDIQWVKPENITKYIPYTYLNIAAVLEQGLGL